MNPKAKFCNMKERMRFKREAKRPEKTLTIKTETLTKNPNSTPITLTKVETLTSDNRLGKLVFTKDQPIEERIKFYKSLFPESGFVPNWIRNGFLTKEEALKNAIACVNKNVSVSDLGLGI